ncbi:MAG: 3D-(3,5/4)-trihydroxycyclohexane-1,2-dione acylhydrolase (decyclizing), partial [SAR324 cluster bacterium]|nr:3D-(3,5/4)-trihydroxycyclohexane-1,2-dione acylhydrolase (decyclizing) [SAR324 cluster bacterium]
SRFFDRITRPEQILTSLPEAMRMMTNPAETGAVTIALPQDIQGYAYDYPTRFFEKRVWRIERSCPNPERIEEATDLLKCAKKPYIIAGGGIHYSEAWNELAALSKQLGIPVGETHAGRGSIQSDSELLLGGTGHLGTPGAGSISEEADVVLCVGTRLHDFVTGSNSAFQNPNVKFISINVNDRDAHKLGALPIVADARLALSALLEAGIQAGIQTQKDWVNKVRFERNSWENIKNTEVFIQHAGEKISQGHLIGILNDEMNEGDVLVAAAGTIPADLTKLFDVNGGKELHLEFGNSCMGYDIPAA